MFFVILVIDVTPSRWLYVRFSAEIIRVRYRSISAINTEVLQIVRVPSIRSITHDVINELELCRKDRPFRHLLREV